MMYNGIELEIPKEKPQLTHSVSMDLIRGSSSSQNMDWADKLSELPYGKLRSHFPKQYTDACELLSLMKLDYQVCNGGIEQYFGNRYNEAFPPRSENDAELYDIDVQKSAFQDLVLFALEIFPDRTEEYTALAAAATAFDKLSFEENALLYETVYCDEDEYIIDEETGEEIENPDFFEPYEESYHEDIIHGGDGFDDIFYKANEYMEELFELRAQFICKDLAREMEKHASEHTSLYASLKESMPEAFRKPSLAARIQSAETRAAAAGKETAPEKSAVPDLGVHEESI